MSTKPWIRIFFTISAFFIAWVHPEEKTVATATLSVSDHSQRRQTDSAHQIDTPQVEQPVKYNGAKVLRILIAGEENKKTVDELQIKYDGKSWMELEQFVDILFDKVVVTEVQKDLRNTNITYDVLIDDLQHAIEVENPPKEEIELLQNRKGHRMTWKAYHRVADVHSYLDYLAKTYPDLCKVENIGNSVEGRPLKVLKISNGKPGNKAIWIDGGIHAREWISPASATYIIDQLTEYWEDLPDFLRNTDWYILPIVNPDGYEHTHTVDRLWRKNRKKGYQTFGRSCNGVDLNRNFGYRWGGEGSSRQPCSQIYGGSQAFSEPESLALKNYLPRIPNLKGYISIHSYGQYILYPWGYDRTVPPDYIDLENVAKQSAEQILVTTGSRYRTGGAGALLYPAAGGSDDWAKASVGIKYAFTVELRDEGRHGFILPAHLIETTSKEALIVVTNTAKAVSIL